MAMEQMKKSGQAINGDGTDEEEWAGGQVNGDGTDEEEWAWGQINGNGTDEEEWAWGQINGKELMKKSGHGVRSKVDEAGEDADYQPT